MGNAGRNLQGIQLAVGEVGRNLDVIRAETVSALPPKARWLQGELRENRANYLRLRRRRAERDSPEGTQFASFVKALRAVARRLPALRRSHSPAVRANCDQALVALLHGVRVPADEKIRSIARQF